MSKNKNRAKSLAMSQNRNMAMQPNGSPNVLLRSEEMIITHSGPIPSADELRKYEEVLPGSADRIMSMAEKQSDHRQKLESAVIASNIENSKRGQLFAFIISIAVIGAGFTLIMFDKDGLGLAMIIGDLVVLVTTFIGNRIGASRELSQKRRESKQDGKK